MSLRSVLRPLMLGMVVAGLAGAAAAHAQVPIPPNLPIPIPTTLPTGVPTTVPGLPPLPTIPGPGGTPAVPNIPGLKGGNFSPTGSLLMPFMKDEAKKIYESLRNALSSSKRAAVEGIPLLFDENKEEVNAFAGCDDAGKTFVVVTAGMYQMVDLMAATRATDETFGTSYYEEYIKELARQQEGKARILPLPPGMLDVTKSLDQRKLRRQRQLFDESMAYILGHEISHHANGHLGSACTGGAGGTIKPGDIVRLARKIVPAVNQINELDADKSGTELLLTAGQNQSDYPWSEGGALLVIDFFKKLRDLNPGAVLFTFMMTHPAPEVRGPVVKQTANIWRLTHPGATTGAGGSTGPSPLPIPTAFPLPK